MNKAKKTISLCTVASVLLTSSISSVKVSAATPPENPRLWGADRYETAVKISQEGWNLGSNCAVLASGEGYADALCAAPLAKANNAPILLTKRNELNAKTMQELKRLNVKQVYIIGGEGSVSKTIENTIKTTLNVGIERLAGGDRYETSVKVAEKLGSVKEAVLASGEGYADALSAAPVAAIKGIPIVLTQANTFPNSTKNYITSKDITKTYVIGGTGSVSEKVKNLVPNPQRLGGQDRFETNSKVMEGFSVDFDFHNAYVALGNGQRGDEFADSLSGSALAAAKQAPVIITDKNLSNYTKNFADANLYPTTKFTVLGGVANVSDNLVDSLKITSEFMDKEGTTYNKEIAKNATIQAKDVSLKDTKVHGDLYVEGNNAAISNVVVDGTVYVNPGKEGVSNLDKVTASKIVVLSGAKDSVHLNSVKADTLNVLSKGNVRVVSEGNTAIKTTTVLSNAMLENLGGDFGSVKIAKTANDKSVELKGKFKDAIVVKGQVNLKANSDCNISKIEVRTDKNDVVSFDGDVEDVEVYTGANIKLSKNARGYIKAVTKEAENNTKIDVEKGSYAKVKNFDKGNVSGEGAKNATSSSSSGGSSSSSSHSSHEEKDEALSQKFEDMVTVYNNYIDNHNITTYPKVSYNDRKVSINMPKVTKERALSETFNNKKDGLTENRLKNLASYLDIVKVGDKKLSQYVASRNIFSNYYEKGNIKYAAIAEKLNELSFKDIENKLVKEIENKETKVPAITYGDFKLVSLDKNKTEIDLKDIKYKDLKENLDKMINPKNKSYEEVTYGDFEGTYSLVFENEEGKQFDYTVEVNFSK